MAGVRGHATAPRRAARLITNKNDNKAYMYMLNSEQGRPVPPGDAPVSARAGLRHQRQRPARLRQSRWCKNSPVSASTTSAPTAARTRSKTATAAADHYANAAAVDPNHDNYDVDTNPNGTENDWLHEDGEPYRDDGLDGVPEHARRAARATARSTWPTLARRFSSYGGARCLRRSDGSATHVRAEHSAPTVAFATCSTSA